MDAGWILPRTVRRLVDVRAGLDQRSWSELSTGRLGHNDGDLRPYRRRPPARTLSATAREDACTHTLETESWFAACTSATPAVAVSFWKFVAKAGSRPTSSAGAMAMRRCTSPPAMRGSKERRRSGADRVMTDTDRLGPVTESDPALSAWTVDSADFPVGGTTADVFRFAVRYAVLAPSSHNTQPWQFDVQDAHLDLFL